MMKTKPNTGRDPRRSLPFGRGMLLMLFTAGTCIAQEPPLYYTAQLAADNAVVDLKVNGFPLESLPDEGTQGARGVLVAAFLKQGANVIELRITPMTDDEGAAKRQHMAELEVFESLVLGDEQVRTLLVSRVTDLDGEQPNKRTEFRKAGEIDTVLRTRGDGAPTLLNWSFGSGELSQQNGGTAERIQLTADLPRATLATLPWQAPQPAVDAAAVTAIRAKVVALHGALSAKDWVAVEAALDAKLQRQATAFGIPRNEVFTGTLETLDEIFFSEGFAMTALDPANLQINAVEDLNLFKVTVEGGDPLRGEGVEYAYSMPLFFSWINDAWEIVE